MRSPNIAARTSWPALGGLREQGQLAMTADVDQSLARLAELLLDAMRRASEGTTPLRSRR
jgi:hypothetical protein